MSAPILFTPPFAASPLKWRSACLALFLLPARRAHAAAYTPAVAITNWSPLIAVGESTSTYVYDPAFTWITANSVTHTWTGSGQVCTTDWTQGPYVTGANFLAVTPGVFDYTVVVDWSNHYLNIGLDPADCRTTNVLPAAFTVVNVTNVTATAYHVAEGHAPITLTAHMTPVNAPAKVTWSIVQGEGGGNLSAASGLTTQYDGGLGWSACKVRAICGTNTTDVVINIYRVTGITVSANPVAAGDPVTFTAITDPPNCPLPIIWNISTNTDLSVTNAFASPGLINVTATLGSSIAECTLTNVGVKEVQYEWPRDSGIWTPCPFPWYLPKDAEFRVRAKRNPPDIDPENETWPKPVVWSGEAHGSGVIGLAKFPVASSNWVDYRWITAACGTTNPNPAAVFSIDSVQVSTNHAAIGTNQLSLTVTTTPALGWQDIGQLIVWSCTNALPNPAQGLTSAFPCDQAGVFTVTATLGSTCGFSSASTNINGYRVTEVTASPSLVAVGAPVTLTATTEPPNCPLPLTWNLSTNTGSIITNAFPPGYFTNTVTLGTSEQTCLVTSVGIDRIEYRDADLDDAWLAPPSPLYTLTGVSVPFRAYPVPSGASWPSNNPIWSVDGVDVGPGDVYTLPGGPVAASATNTSKIRARCGTSYKDASVLFFKSELVSGPAIYWEGRSMSEWGVGEKVYITNKISPSDLSPSVLNLSWGTNFPGPANFDPGIPIATLDDAVIEGGYEITGYRGKNYLGNSVPIELGRKVEPVFAPTSVQYVAILPVPFSTNSFYDVGATNVTGSGVWHEKDTATVGLLFAVFVQPIGRDYSKLNFSEGIAQYSADGILSPQNGTTHGRTTGILRISVSHTNGWLLNRPDRARVDARDVGLAAGITPAAAGFPTGGSRSIQIPFEWRLPSAPNGLDGLWFKITDIPSSRNISGNGDASGVKQNVSFSASFTNASSAYSSTSLLPP